MQCSKMSAAFSTFGAKSKIALTGVRSRVRESLTKRLIYYCYLFMLFTEIIDVRAQVLSDNLDKNQQNYDTFESQGTHL